jgi:hypothetical protein
MSATGIRMNADANGFDLNTIFRSYDKIAETPNKWNLSETDYRALKKTNWVVMEKIHGANFCIVTDGTNVRFAKRKELLSEVF